MSAPVLHPAFADKIPPASPTLGSMIDRHMADPSFSNSLEIRLELIRAGLTAEQAAYLWEMAL